MADVEDEPSLKSSGGRVAVNASDAQTGSRHRVRPSGYVVGLAAIMMVAVGLIAGLLVAPRLGAQVTTPASLRSVEGPSTLSVSSETFDDGREVAFSPTVAPSSTVLAPRGGVVTTSACQVGKEVSAGEAIASIDAQPIVAWHSKYPLYREIRPGERGPDVAATKAEITRLGVAAGDGDMWDARAASAWNQLMTERGVSDTNGRVELGRLAFLPSSSIKASQCPQPGATVRAGQSLMSVGGGIVGLQIAADVADAVPGDRVVSYGDSAAAPVDNQGNVSDDSLMAAVAASSDFAHWKSDHMSLITLTYALAKPRDAYAVPPSAIFAMSGSKGCVISDGKKVAVDVLASQLGSSYVEVADPGARLGTVTIADVADRTSSGDSCG